MKRFTIIGVAAVGSLIMASAAMAQGAPQTPEQKQAAAVLTRQGLFKVQGFVFGPVGGMLRGAPFDAAAAQKAGARLAVTGGLIPEVFATDTHAYTGTPTKAREGIWTNKSDFDAKASDLVKAAGDLEAAAKTGDEAATKKAAGAVGKAAAPATTSSATSSRQRSDPKQVLASHSIRIATPGALNSPVTSAVVALHAAASTRIRPRSGSRSTPLHSWLLAIASCAGTWSEGFCPWIIAATSDSFLTKV